MEDHVEIRRMTLEDLDEVTQLEKESFSVPWSGMLLSESLNNAFDFIWVLTADGKTAGYCLLRIIEGEGELQRIAVFPSFRGRGYSRKLMETLERFAREKNTEAIILEVRVSNLAAVNLYKSCGFEIGAVRKRYYKDPVEDALIMWKRKWE